MPGGSRPENGWIVHAPNGVSYQMNTSLGYGTPTTPVLVFTATGVITMGGLANGVTTMLDGTRPTNGSFVIAPNGIIYQMVGDSGVYWGIDEFAQKKKNSGDVAGNNKNGVDPPKPKDGTKNFILFDPNALPFLVDMGKYTNGVEKALSAIYGSPVEIYKTTGWTGETFVKWWNECLPYNVDSIVIFGHSDPTWLILDDKALTNGTDKDQLQWYHVDKLKTKNVKMLILTGCQTGNIDHYNNEGWNIASDFAGKLASGGTVIAPDGEFNLHAFSSKVDVTGQGLVAYTKKNGKINKQIIPDTKNKHMSVEELIKMAHAFITK